MALFARRANGPPGITRSRRSAPRCNDQGPTSEERLLDHGARRINLQSSALETDVGGMLECGHVASPRGVPFVLGARSGPAATVCWTCDEERQIAELLTAQEVTAYFDGGGRTITTWTGAKLADVTWLTRTERYTQSGGMAQARGGACACECREPRRPGWRVGRGEGASRPLPPLPNHERGPNDATYCQRHPRVRTPLKPRDSTAAVSAASGMKSLSRRVSAMANV